MLHRTIVAAALLVAVPLVCRAQPSQRQADVQDRQITALSKRQIADLRAGRGDDLVMAAELNGYPGPSHVLELADKLQLSAEQKDSVQKLFGTMKEEAVLLGERLIAAEAALDRSFAAGTITQPQLEDQVQAIAALQGELRITHLKYHLAIADVLTPEQRARYAELRGYAGKVPGPAAPPAGHMHLH